MSQAPLSETTHQPVPPPRDLAWRGFVTASGYWFAAGGAAKSTTEARARILDLWQPGTRVFAADDGGLFILLVTPRLTRAEESIGSPLVLIEKGLLSAAPIDGEADRVRDLATPASTGETVVALVRGGRWDVIRLDAAQVVDPASWLDLGKIVVVPDCLTLGAPPAPVTDGLPSAEFDARKAFGKVAVAAEPSNLADFVASLRGLDETTRQERDNTGARNTFGAGMLRAANRIRTGAQAPTFTRSGNNTAGEAGKIVVVSKTHSFSSQPSTADDPWAWARWAAARFAGLTGLSVLLGQKQAQYLQKMLDLFEKGDLEQALRHAIPLGGDTDGVLRNLPPSFAPLKPRASLAIDPRQAPAKTALHGATDLLDHLKRLYRQSFERLEGEGRIDEAAFVLAVLLKDNEEAVNFLEKHKRFQSAADMAEARGLPTGLVIRLRFLAGERARAVAYARRTGAWAEAVSQMERNPAYAKEAQAMRLEWAASLARAGAYTQAIDVGSSVPEARNLVRAWMGRVVESGGVVGARMSARRLAMFADCDAEWRTEALALLASEQPDEADERRAFSEELTRPGVWKQPHAEVLLHSLARVAVRSIGRDTSLGYSPPPPQAQYDALLLAAGDAVLRADVPTLRDLASAAPAVVRHRALSDRAPGEPPIVIDAGDTGLLPVEDAVYLPSGRTLVALGEMGVRLLTRDGRTIREWSTVPAHRLVVADSGNIAIALGRRGRLWRLTRLHLVTGAATRWCDAEIPAFAPDCDGSLWMAALPNGGDSQALAAIDLQGPPDRLTTLWRTPLEDGQFVAVARTASSCVALSVLITHNPEPFTVPPEGKTIANWQRWLFEMPSLTMRDRFLWSSQSTRALEPEAESRRIWRGTVDPAAGGAVVVSETALLPVSAASAPRARQTWPTVSQRRNSAEFSLPHRADYPRTTNLPTQQVLGNGWLVDILYPQGSQHVVADIVRITAGVSTSATTAVTRLQIRLAGADAVGARISGSHATFWDDRGRVLIIDLDTGDLAVNLRLR